MEILVAEISYDKTGKRKIFWFYLSSFACISFLNRDYKDLYFKETCMKFPEEFLIRNSILIS